MIFRFVIEDDHCTIEKCFEQASITMDPMNEQFSSAGAEIKLI